MSPSECRNFETCNASVCPLAPMQGLHALGERVCVYALASGKAGAAERYRDFPEFAEVLANLPAVVARFPAIGKAVDQAAKRPLPPDRSVYLARHRNAKKGVSPHGAPTGRLESRP
jgi:hypothetical protein